MSKIGIIDNIEKVGKYIHDEVTLNVAYKKHIEYLHTELKECDEKLQNPKKGPSRLFLDFLKFKTGGKGTKKKNKKFRKSRKKISHNKNNGSKNRFNRRQHRRRENHNIQ